MDRQWMYGNRATREYINGVEEFCKIAVEHQKRTKCVRIFCPCRDCDNAKRWANINKIEGHLIHRGFTTDYDIWYFHGEKPTDNKHDAKQTAVLDVNQHHLSQKSYGREQRDWNKLRALAAAIDSTSCNIELGRYDFVKVIDEKVQNRNSEDNCEVVLKKSKVVQIDEAVEEGTPRSIERSVCNQSNGIGKRDCGGNVKALVCRVYDILEKADQKCERSSRYGCSSEVLEALKVKLIEAFEAWVEEKIEEKLQEKSEALKAILTQELLAWVEEKIDEKLEEKLETFKANLSQEFEARLEAKVEERLQERLQAFEPTSSQESKAMSDEK